MKNKIYPLVATVCLGFFLRVHQLQANPPGFYSDEASYAYNAYSILKTGKDEHGVFLPITAEAFGDFKLPVMLYSIVGSFALFGASEWTARLPGVLYGTGTIVAVYLLMRELRREKENDYLSLLAALFLAITPAHIFVSRGTWELTPALFYITIGTVFFLKAIHAKIGSAFSRGYYVLAVTSFALSLYAYNSARVFVPLFGLSLIGIYRKEIMKQLQSRATLITICLSLVLAFIFCLPILKAIRTPEVTQRAKYISIFYDKGVDARLFDAIRSDSCQPVKITQFLHNKPLFYFMDYAKRYLSHFDFNFLFVIGDVFEIFQIIGIGFLPLILLPVTLIGMYACIKNRPPWIWLILSWLLISPVASAFTIFTPSISRAQNMVIPLVIIAAYGSLVAYQWFQEKFPRRKMSVILIPIASVLVLINVGYFYNQYFTVTPHYVAEKWNDGIKYEVQYAFESQNKYDQIIVSSSKAPMYIFYAWFMRYDPQVFQSQSVTNHTPDQNGLNFTSQFGKFYFTKDISSVQKNTEQGRKILFVGFENEIRNPTMFFFSRNEKIIGEGADTL